MDKDGFFKVQNYISLWSEQRIEIYLGMTFVNQNYFDWEIKSRLNSVI